MSTIPLKTVQLHSWDAPDAKIGERGSVIFAAFVAVLVTFAFTMPITDSWKHSTYENFDNSIEEAEASVSEGSLSRQIAIGGLGLLGLAALAWPDGKRLHAQTVLGACCIAYLAWCLASCVWSDDVSISLRRWIALACEVAAGVAIAKRTTARQFAWIVFSCTLAWLGLGLLAELSQGTFRPWEAGHRFAGVFHPNIMGVNAALLAMSSLYLAKGNGRASWLLILVAIAGVGFLLLTRSRTSLAAMLVSIAVWWFFTSSNSRKLGFTMFFGLAAVCVAMALGLGMFEITSSAVAMGRGDDDLSSFTGRLPLWQELLEDYVPSRAWAGHGYGAFWTADRIDEVSKSQAWMTSHAHSTYIDLVLNVGYVGAALCVLAMVMAMAWGLRRETQNAAAGYGLIAMIVAFGLASGLLETYIGNTWFLSFFGICGVSYLLVEEQGSDQSAGRVESSGSSVMSLGRRSRANAGAGKRSPR